MVARKEPISIGYIRSILPIITGTPMGRRKQFAAENGAPEMDV